MYAYPIIAISYFPLNPCFIDAVLLTVVSVHEHDIKTL